MQLLFDWRAVRGTHQLFTAWTVHEGESYTQSAPSVLEQRAYAVCVEDVSTTKFNAWLLRELTGVADAAFFSLWCDSTVFCNTGWLQAWQASAFPFDTEALMFALFDLSAEEEIGGVINLQWHVIVSLLFLSAICIGGCCTTR